MQTHPRTVETVLDLDFIVIQYATSVTERNFVANWLSTGLKIYQMEKYT